jgi:outer membrane protein assembly factor BamB
MLARVRLSRFRHVCLAALILAAVGMAGATRSAERPIRHRLLCFEYGNGPNRLLQVDEDGKQVWEHRSPGTAVMFQVLPDGHLLYGFGGKPTGVQEIDRSGAVVWRYESACPQVLGCRRLANGNTLVAEQGPCRAVEVDRTGRVVHVTPLTTSEAGYHLQVRNVHRLPNGNILAAHEGEGAVREVDPSGKVVWEYSGVTNAGEALRLKNGNTLIACGTQKRVIEVTPEKRIAWEFNAADAPEANLTWISSLQVLSNGHLLIGNFLRGQEGKGAHALEVTHDKRVVWSWADHQMIPSLTTVRALDDPDVARLDDRPRWGR